MGNLLSRIQSQARYQKESKPDGDSWDSCKACGAQFEAHKYETPHDGWQSETLCPRCLRESTVNAPEDYYEGLWRDKYAHPSHRVISKITLELEEAHAHQRKG